MVGSADPHYKILGDGAGSRLVHVFGSRGFLGIGDKHVARPWEQVRIAADGESAMVSMNKDLLAEAPAFRTKEDRQAEADRAGARQGRQPRRPISGRVLRPPVRQRHRRVERGRTTDAAGPGRFLFGYACVRPSCVRRRGGS